MQEPQSDTQKQGAPSLETHDVEKGAPLENPQEELVPVEESSPASAAPLDNPTPPRAEEVTAVPSVALPRLRTFKEDIASAIKDQNASFTSIVAQEVGRRGRTPARFEATPTRDYKKIGLAAASAVLVLLGIGLLTYVLFFYERNTSGTPVEEIPSLIFADDRRTLSIDNESSRGLLSALRNERDTASLSLGKILHVYLTRTDEGGIPRPIESVEFLRAINAQLSDSFIRSLEQEFMVGVHVFDGNQPLIIFTTHSYEHAFAGMLQFEEGLRTALSPFFAGAEAASQSNATTTPTVFAPKFQDLVIQNTDVRAIVGSDGKPVMLYAFPNPRTLIITTNEHTLEEIITRMQSTRVL